MRRALSLVAMEDGQIDGFAWNMGSETVGSAQGLSRGSPSFLEGHAAEDVLGVDVGPLAPCTHQAEARAAHPSTAEHIRAPDTRYSAISYRRA